MTQAYDAIARQYDRALVGDRWMRHALWARYRAHIRPGMRVLDIGCGTGIDAVYLARKGNTVEGIDSAPAMLEIARRRAMRHNVQVRFRRDSIDGFQASGPYDAVISAFAALNTVPDLTPVAAQIAAVLRPGGKAVLHLVNRYSLWELLGDIRHGTFPAFPAVRTFDIGDTSLTHYLGTTLETYKAFEPHFRLLKATGYGILRPPHTVRRIPSFVTKLLGTSEMPFRSMPPLRDLGRFFVLELERR